MYRTIFLLIALLNTFACKAGTTPPRPQCLTDLGKDSDFTNAVATKIGTNDVQQWLTDHKTDFYTLIGDGIKKYCLLKTPNIPEFNRFLDTNAELPIKLKVGDKWYDFFISKTDVFNYTNFPTIVIVSTDTQKYSIGAEKEAKELVSNIKNTKCAQYWAGVMGLTPSHNTALSDAAKNAFIGKYTDKYALRYARPQGALYEKRSGIGAATKFEYVEDTNYYRQRENIKIFSEQLKDTACTGENIAVYMMYKSNSKDNKYTVVDGPYIIP